MKKSALYKTVLAGLFAAIIYVTTAFISVPLGIGYANLGDCFVLFSGMLLGPLYGFCAASVGSTLADLTLGYAIYAPVTFFVKGVMALIFGLFLTKSKKSLPASIAAGALCEIIMVGSYLVFELCLYGGGAFASVPGNLIQGLVGIIGAVLLGATAKRLKLTEKL